ncbi:OmpA family protein, partial [Mesorhizobium sp. M4B.F.Ca.ET.203.01.1.1]|uniref:OmpA family protein n=1 Tax=Mesorhizobium sp. M4B.F.Ca.ET.203.01.1.1 TaxID=2563953 RepID=UPI001FE05EC6
SSHFGGSGSRASTSSISRSILSRSTSVVKFLIENGVPANRLVAAGFGEFQPLDPPDTDEARTKNRRIELKLTER